MNNSNLIDSPAYRGLQTHKIYLLLTNKMKENINSITEIDCLVFSTSVQDQQDLESVASVFDCISNITDWSIDLENWENVLRVEGVNIDPPVLTKKLRKKGIFIRRMYTS